MDTQFLLYIFLMLFTAWLFGAFFIRLGMPGFLGHLLAGILLGPTVLGVVELSHSIELLAELGIFFVMFHTGMELDPKELLGHFWPSMSVALGGFILPFALGFLVAWIFGGTLYQSLFMGMGISITAIAVQAVILQEMRIHKSEIGHVIIGAALVDDILALISLSALIGLARTGEVSLPALGLILGKTILFFGGVILVGHFIMPRITLRLQDLGSKTFMFAITTAIFLAYLAELAGLHMIIGAFLAGQFVRKEALNDRIFKNLNNTFFAVSYGFLVPIFFASLAFHLQLSWNLQFLFFNLIIIAAAIAGKLVGCGIGAAFFGYNLRENAIIGFGMNGRGAVEMVVATVVLNLSDSLLSEGIIDAPLLTKDQFSGLVTMAFVTTLMAPIFLKRYVEKACQPGERAAFCDLWDEERKPR
ncbi:MAG: cation:proton antiporter [Desulfohalobiaceae bacterium]|nr:cation:proton antiporter [Desulfohalobiaceae bacterium]